MSACVVFFQSFFKMLQCFIVLSKFEVSLASVTVVGGEFRVLLLRFVLKYVKASGFLTFHLIFLQFDGN